MPAIAGFVGDLVGLIGIAIAVLSAAGAPAYVFEDVLELSEPVAYGLGAGVWAVATVVIMDAPGLDLMAAIVVQRLVGITIGSPLTLAGVVLTVLYAVAAVGYAVEDDDGG